MDNRTKAAIEAWEKLASQEDLIGKKVRFDNRVGGTDNTTTITKISVVDGRFKIESQDEQGAPADDLHFKIDDERYPSVVGDCIFCDLDDNRQIRIILK